MAVYDWTGLYFGGNVGGAWANYDYDDPSTYKVINNAASGNSAFTGGPTNIDPSSSSFLGGFQAGGNYQTGRLVLGTEYE